MQKKNINKINTEASQFLSLQSAYALSTMFYFNFTKFTYVIQNVTYEKFIIPKKNGGKRIIESPDENLQFIQKKINTYLQAIYFQNKPNEVYGFVQSVINEEHNHNIVTNAKNHIGKNYVLNIDLKDFFHSVSASRVRTLFQNAPFDYSEDLSTCLALICCWNKRLPMGASTSPVLSNFCCLELDNQLIELSRKYDLTYTRYADDLTFSSNEKIAEEILNEIKTVISFNEFEINKKKVRLQSKFKQQSVTGIKVNQKANVDRKYIRNIRAILHDIKINGLEKATIKHYNAKEVSEKLVNTFYLSIAGKIAFVGQVRGKDDLIYTKLRQELNLFQHKLISNN